MKVMYVHRYKEIYKKLSSRVILKNMIVATETHPKLFHRRKFSMFDQLVFTFYWVDSIENCGVFFSYYRDSKLNACDYFVIFSVAFSADYGS